MSDRWRLGERFDGTVDDAPMPSQHPNDAAIASKTPLHLVNMVVQQHVLNWLYSVLTSALSQYPSLSSRTDVYTFPTGASALLLHLSGTIPVLFRGTTYRFPISLWVPHAYPRDAPLVYVTPTDSMVVRPGQHVDPQGQVYHPYVVGWSTFWDFPKLRFSPAKMPQGHPRHLRNLASLSVSNNRIPRRHRSQPALQFLHCHRDMAGRPITQTLPPQPQPPPPPPPPDLIDDDLTLTIPPTSSVSPPPIPPNPEKDALLHQLARTLYDMRQNARAQNDASLLGLQAQRNAMIAAANNLQSESAQLGQLSTDSLRKADAIIESSARHPEANIDELLVPPTVVGNQLYEVVAEERSPADAIFVLGRAVERGRIAPATFAKTTRSLAREWYLKKALERKIGQGMGLEAA
ncbi:UEV domain-containing protein [Lasiosphaeria miniovina]|uniref:UEV domain-containing protein n=1 Tax=Lasiosphaeria miniovina TaxID=1954250 RepID=A0AA40BF08_9PEZI|nr:UEV domain-containing protein [Lasiosphaeria miniovina]KAK0733052.1 UEV domain-containing protein [Lasiosphaeria miniovina]